MYNPSFNTILVELQADEWGGGNDDSMLGKSYREGMVVSLGLLVPTQAYPFDSLSETHKAFLAETEKCIGKHIMFNEGVEAGTVHEVDGKVYGFIYWYDIRGVKDEQ